jgi:hypothetical protein
VLAQYTRSLADYCRQSDDEEDRSLVQFYQQQTKKYQYEAAFILEQISGSKAERQSRGKKFRREHTSFMRSLAPLLHRWLGSRYYEAVAVITNAAFELNAGAEDVRSACRGLPKPRKRHR